MTVVTGAERATIGLSDLFVYRDDNITDWFFAEVKGPTDKVSDEQEEKSDLLDQAAGKNVVRLIELEKTTERSAPPGAPVNRGGIHAVLVSSLGEIRGGRCVPRLAPPIAPFALKFWPRLQD